MFEISAPYSYLDFTPYQNKKLSKLCIEYVIIEALRILDDDIREKDRSDYSNSCRQRRATPTETANSGPVSRKTFSRNAGESTFAKGSPPKTSV